MSINEVQGPLSAATKRTAERERVFGNLPADKPKKTRVAENSKFAPGNGSHVVTDPFGAILKRFGTMKAAKKFAGENGGVYRKSSQKFAEPLDGDEFDD